MKTEPCWIQVDLGAEGVRGYQTRFLDHQRLLTVKHRSGFERLKGMKSGDACHLELMKRLDESQEAKNEKTVRGKQA
jgi:hypothetical protein